MAVAGEIRGRGRPWQGLASGYPPSPRCQTQTTSRQGFLKLLDIQREILSRSPSLSLVGLLEKKGEKGNNKSRVFVFEYKFKFEFV
jgi:hypothetical protein